MPAPAGGGQKAASEACGRDLENLRHAWRWALERGEAASIAPFLRPFHRFFNLQSRFAEGEALIAEAGDPPLRALALAIRAALCFRADRSTEAEALARLALDLLPQEMEGAAMARMLTFYTLGALAWYDGNFTAARDHYRTSLRHADASRDDYDLAYAMNNLGVVEGEIGDPDEARRLYEATLERNRRIGNRRGPRWCWRISAPS